MVEFDVANANCHVANGFRDWSAETGGSVGWSGAAGAGGGDGGGGGGAGGGVAVAEDKYDPDIAPSSFGVVDDEFRDNLIRTDWKKVGSPGTITEAQDLGFLFIEK